MTPIEARAHIIDSLLQIFASADRQPDIREYRGVLLSVEEVQNLAVRSPCILVAFRSLQNVTRRNAELYCQAQWVIHVIAGDTRAERRNDLAHEVALRLMDRITLCANLWEFAQGYADALSAAEVPEIALDQLGIAMQRITWQQDCSFTVPNAAGLMTEFMGFDAEHFKPGANVITLTPLAETSATY